MLVAPHCRSGRGRWPRRRRCSCLSSRRSSATRASSGFDLDHTIPSLAVAALRRSRSRRLACRAHRAYSDKPGTVSAFCRRAQLTARPKAWSAPAALARRLPSLVERRPLTPDWRERWRTWLELRTRRFAAVSIHRVGMGRRPRPRNLKTLPAIQRPYGFFEIFETEDAVAGTARHADPDPLGMADAAAQPAARRSSIPSCPSIRADPYPFYREPAGETSASTSAGCWRHWVLPRYDDIVAVLRRAVLGRPPQAERVQAAQAVRGLSPDFRRGDRQPAHDRSAGAHAAPPAGEQGVHAARGRGAARAHPERSSTSCSTASARARDGARPRPCLSAAGDRHRRAARASRARIAPLKQWSDALAVLSIPAGGRRVRAGRARLRRDLPPTCGRFSPSAGASRATT